MANLPKLQAVQDTMPWVEYDVALQAFSEAHDPESPLHISGKVRYCIAPERARVYLNATYLPTLCI